MNNSTLTDDQQAYVKGLRDMADFLEAKPEFIAFGGLNIHRATGSADDFKSLAKRFGTSTKSADDIFYNLNKSFGPHTLQLFIRRSAICEKRLVTKTVEVEEWVCDESILAGAK